MNTPTNISTNNNASNLDDSYQALANELVSFHNKAPYMFILGTEDVQFVSCNDTYNQFGDITSKEYYTTNIYRFIPESQPDGSNSIDLLFKSFQRCSQNGHYSLELMLHSLDNIPRKIYLTLQKITIKNTTFIACYQFPISDINSSPELLAKRNKLLFAITEISILLLSQFEKESNALDLDKIMPNVLSLLGSAAHSDRCFVGENYMTDSASLIFMKQIYEGVAEGVEAVQDSEMLDHISYEPDLYDLLSSGNCMNTIVKDLDEYNRSLLEPQGIKSILIAPVIIDDFFGGFIGYDNCKTEELGATYEEEILMAAGYMIGIVIDKFENKTEFNLKKHFFSKQDK